MTVDQMASGKSALVRELAKKLKKGSQTLPKRELNSSVGLKSISLCPLSKKCRPATSSSCTALAKSTCTGKDASRRPFALLHRSPPSLDSCFQLLLSSAR